MEQSTGNKWRAVLFIFLIGMAERQDNRKGGQPKIAGEMRCCLRFKQYVTDFFILIGNQKAV